MAGRAAETAARKGHGMQNFTFHNPVKVVFGRGSIADLIDLVPRDVRILMTYGGGSIKLNGVYDQVMAGLQPFDPHILRADAFANLPQGFRFLQKRGFYEAFRETPGAPGRLVVPGQPLPAPGRCAQDAPQGDIHRHQIQTGDRG